MREADTQHTKEKIKRGDMVNNLNRTANPSGNGKKGRQDKQNTQAK